MIPIGLAANKQLMDAKFSTLVMPGTAELPDTGGTIYKAAYHAFYDAIKRKMDESETQCDDPDLAPIIEANKQESLRALQRDAHEFASFFNDAMKECLDEISNQIDAHIKSMIITILAPTPGPSGTVLACGVGPVSGTIGANNLSPAGGITIA